MRVKYIGPHTGGVELPTQGDLFVAHGATIEVPDDVGASLCEQVDNWQPVTESKKAAPADTVKGGN